jgi:hypothetical protein
LSDFQRLSIEPVVGELAEHRAHRTDGAWGTDTVVWTEMRGMIAPRISESDGFAEQQDGAAPGVGFCVEDEKAVDGARPPVGDLGADAFQREGVVFDAAQRGAQVGYHLLRPDDPDRAGGAAGVAG